MDLRLARKKIFPGECGLHFLLPPSLCFALHYAIPGGILGAHNAVLFTLSGALGVFYFLTSQYKFWQFLCIALVSILFYSGLAVLFGAHPQKLVDTTAWALLMTSLTTLPILKLPQEVEEDGKFNWERIFLHNQLCNVQESQVFVVSLATLLGAWVGASPMLLDWNTSWQVWPIACSGGALIGSTCGYIFSIVLALFKTLLRAQAKF